MFPVDLKKMLKILQVGAWMHLLASMEFGLAVIILFAAARSKTYFDIISLSTLGFAFCILVYGSECFAFKNLYKDRYLPLMVFFSINRWDPIHASPYRLTPCQRLTLKTAAYDSGLSAEVDEFFQQKLNKFSLRRWYEAATASRNHKGFFGQRKRRNKR